MPTRRFLWLLALCALVACTSPTTVDVPVREAGLRGPVSPPPMHDLVSEHRTELGISLEQEQAIRAIADGARDELDDYHRVIQQRRDELSMLLSAEAPDRVEVDRSIDALGAAETQLRRGELRVLLDIRERLTQEQRDALVALSAGSQARQREPRPTPMGPPPRGPQPRQGPQGTEPPTP